MSMEHTTSADILGQLDAHDPADHARLLAVAEAALERAGDAGTDRYVAEAARNARIANARFEDARANLDDETICNALRGDE